MTQPLCIVISHPQSPSVADCVKNLHRHKWKFELFSAINGRDITTQSWQRLGVTMLDRGKMPRRPGAQGCWFSHFAQWQRSVVQDRPLVIMEHDAMVQDRWPTDIDIDTALIKLYRSAPVKTNTITGQWSKGSHAYTITPEQASALIEHARQHGAQALDKHLGDQVLSWRFLDRDLVTLHARRGPSSTTRMTQ